MMPIGPAPVTSTSSPSIGKARAVCTALPNGSKIAATPQSTGCRCTQALVDGRATYSANAPSTCTPMPRVWMHRCRRPARQLRHRPQTRCPSPLTTSPTCTSVTLAPTSTTSPANSCPTVRGVRDVPRRPLVPVHDVQVGATDPRRPHLDQHIARPDRRVGDVEELQTRPRPHLTRAFTQPICMPAAPAGSRPTSAAGPASVGRIVRAAVVGRAGWASGRGRGGDCRSEERTRFSFARSDEGADSSAPTRAQPSKMGEAPAKYELTGASTPALWAETLRAGVESVLLLPRGTPQEAISVDFSSPACHPVLTACRDHGREACRSGLRRPRRRRLDLHDLAALPGMSRQGFCVARPAWRTLDR